MSTLSRQLEWCDIIDVALCKGEYLCNSFDDIDAADFEVFHVACKALRDLTASLSSRTDSRPPQPEIHAISHLVDPRSKD